MEVARRAARDRAVLDQYVAPALHPRTRSDSSAGWFTGLSGKFLSARTARLLVLAGAERLDKELMIGQMQGKFQLAVLANVGHILHEASVCSPRASACAQTESLCRTTPMGWPRCL